jgi:hypothetical protein
MKVDLKALLAGRGDDLPQHLRRQFQYFFGPQRHPVPD